MTRKKSFAESQIIAATKNTPTMHDTPLRRLRWNCMVERLARNPPREIQLRQADPATNSEEDSGNKLDRTKAVGFGEETVAVRPYD